MVMMRVPPPVTCSTAADKAVEVGVPISVAPAL